ncbi:TetR/AcrR family transcriptional regulator [uncultured Desulfosarcina sp.]|uniref:TetR/AcrR family transcriptional regulator n=1 Tax=uncultured Desulfosarcina sp. TaxID=218289 RepID=UPI0029C63F73|nr:TetR/AcrR family transcriptional regulator [uncultured Desulfosarcina sp.]
MSTFQKLRKEERETRKSLIIDAAMDLFSQKDFHNIGMRDIAKRAGISAAAIYRYFPSRDDVFVEALVRHMKVVEDLFEEKVKEGNTSLEELALGSVDYMLKNESVFQMMGHFMITGQIQPKALDRYNAMQRRFLDILERVNNQTEIGMNNRLVTHAIYASITGVVMAFKNYPGRSPEEIRRHIYRLVQIVSSVFSTGKIPENLQNLPAPDLAAMPEPK